MIWNCPVCGKAFDVLWPHMWAYKRESRYICSWKCLRAYDKPTETRSEENMKGVKRLGSVQNEEAVKCALAGGNPLKYLENCGSKNPSAAWYHIKQKVKEVDPETYAKLPKKIQRKDAVKKEPEVSLADAMQGMQDAADEFFGKYCPDQDNEYLTDEETKRLAGYGKITQPVVYDDMTVREVEGLFGRYRRSDVNGSTYIDFEYTECMDVISLTLEQWRSFRKEQERAAAILGVEL